VGKPNVGKSSFVNLLSGKERSIVTSTAGTTRDSVSTRFTKFGYDFNIIDTAGLRKKSKVKEDLEFYSVMRAVRSIENADICILMMDAERGVEAQDMSIFYLIQKNRKGCVIAVNKWDTIEKETNTMGDFRKAILEKIAPFSDLPLIFTSVINKQRVLDVLKAAASVYENYNRKIPTSKLNEIMLPEIENYPPPSTKGKFIKIKYITQLPSSSPAFAFFCNLPQYIKDPYKRFLENKIRKHFNFNGCPVGIILKKK
jgi:GTP-binding protein